VISDKNITLKTGQVTKFAPVEIASTQLNVHHIIFSEEPMSKIRTFTFRLFSALMLLSLLLVSALSVTTARAAGIYYVTPGGTGNCASWANTCVLQTALTSAVSGDEIWVASGTHKPTTGTDRSITFQLKSGVALYGGFAGTETARDQRNPAINVTILSGEIGVAGNSDNSYHVVTGVNNATLNGFTITAGNANGANSNNSGGGMYNYFSSPILTNVAFSGNSAANYGGGMYNGNSNPILTNITFSGNTSQNVGGGMGNFDNSSPVLTNVTFSGNTAVKGGGMMNDYSCNPTLKQVTFSANSATNYGGGMSNNSSNPVIRNTIFWGNTAATAGAQIYNSGSTPVVSDSVIQGGYAGGTNIITNNPNLGALGDYGGFTQTIPLLPVSSAIDALTSGTNGCGTTILTDQRGVTRPQGGVCDIGAFEFALVTISGNAGIAGATLSYTDGTAKTATADGSGNYSFPVSYNWSGTVTPSMTGYTFTPASKPYTNVIANQTAQNYTATAITYTISGNAGAAGATLSYTDGAAKIATADGSGNYSFAVSYNWSGTVMPSLTGYAFTPASRTYTNVLADQTAQDYTTTVTATYTISGVAGIAGATLSYTDGAVKTVTADSNGVYSFLVSYNWSGTVMPSKTGFVFSPAKRDYANVIADQPAQNYSVYAPAGYVTDTTPTYTWTKVSGATKYEYQVLKGTTILNTYAVGAAACKGITCSNTPSSALEFGTYKWHVRANVGGKWQAYTPFVTFKLAVKPKAGKWDCQQGCLGGRNDIVFYVAPNQASVSKFSVVFYCSSIAQPPFIHSSIPIKNNGFSFTGSIYVKNAKFLTPTHLSGAIGTLHHDFPGCPDQTFPPSVWEAVWRDNTQPLAAGSGVEENPLELILSGFDPASIFINEPAP
jgi:hypothetical protein